MVQKRKIALIGYGYWGKIMLPYLDQLFNVQYVFGRSISPHNRFINNIQLIWDSDVEAVVIATPMKTHYDIVMAAFKCGKHVLCEKPLTLNVQQAIELRNESLLRNLHLAVDFTHSFSYALQEAVRIVSSGTIGDIRYIDLSLMREVKLSRRDGFTDNQLLASKFSHLLSIIDMFADLDGFEFTELYKPYEGIGIINFSNNDITGQMLASSIYPAKHMGVTILGTYGKIKYRMETKPSLHVTWFDRESQIIVRRGKIYYSDETNNLAYTAKYFKDVLENSSLDIDNSALGVTVTQVLVNTCKLH